MNKKVGTVTNEEAEEIIQLFERKVALQELLMSLNSDTMDQSSRNDLYNKIVADMGKTSNIYSAWWGTKGKKYKWESVSTGNWSIDFDTREIYLNA